MTELKVPSVAESITEVTLSRYLVKDGDYVELDQPICELETDKASQEIPSPIAGVVKLVAKEGGDLKVGDLICRIDESVVKPQVKEEPKVAEAEKLAERKPKATKTKEVKEETTSTPVEKPKKEKTSYAKDVPSPAAKKILDEGNLAAKDVSGTGVAGRIT